MTLDDAWQRVRDRLWSMADRLTHTRNRRRAVQRARRWARPERILVVCYGNICRSPYAAARLQLQFDQPGLMDIRVDSAGFIGPGRPANSQGAAIALTLGLDLGVHRSKLVNPADLARANLVLVMTRRQREQLLSQFGVEAQRVELLGDFDIEDPPLRDIDDPYGRSDAEFRRVFAQIDRSITGLSALIAAQGASHSRVSAGPGG